MQHLKKTHTDFDATAILYHARVPAHESRASSTDKQPIRAQVIHEQPIEKEHASMLLYHMGGMSHREGRVCWSGVERILCGRVQEGGSVGDIREVVSKEDIEKVCSGKCLADVFS